jgi:hypothetical protein
MDRQFQCRDRRRRVEPRGVHRLAARVGDSNAFPSVLAPVGLPQTWGTGFAATSPLNGTIGGVGTQRANGSVQSYGVLTLTVGDAWPAVVTEALANAVNFNQPLYVRMTTGGRTGLFEWRNQRDDDGWMTPFAQGISIHLRIKVLDRLTELPPTHPQYMPMPANGTAVTFSVLTNGAPTKDAPLLIGPVHPMQLFADLLDGKYSIRFGSTLHALAPRDTSPGGPWARAIADTSLGTMMFAIDGATPFNKFVEEQICQPLNYAYRFDGSGNVVPVDLASIGARRARCRAHGC